MDHGETTRVLSELLAVNILKPESLINAFGVFAVYAVVFVETGLFFGFFLPGDSLLFVAGVATSSVADKLVGSSLSLPALLVGVPIMAVAGAQLGHFLGARYGRRLFDRPESRMFKAQYVERSEYYFNRFGPAKAVVLGRFVPVVRAFINPVAGILEMPARRFLVWNAVGGVLWTESVMILGNRVAGSLPPSIIDRYVFPVIGVVIVISLLPMIVELVRGAVRRRRGTPGDSPDPRPAEKTPSS